MLLPLYADIHTNPWLLPWQNIISTTSFLFRRSCYTPSPKKKAAKGACTQKGIISTSTVGLPILHVLLESGGTTPPFVSFPWVYSAPTNRAARPSQWCLNNDHSISNVSFSLWKTHQESLPSSLSVDQDTVLASAMRKGGVSG